MPKPSPYLVVGAFSRKVYSRHRTPSAASLAARRLVDTWRPNDMRREPAVVLVATVDRRLPYTPPAKIWPYVVHPDGMPHEIHSRYDTREAAERTAKRLKSLEGRRAVVGYQAP